MDPFNSPLIDDLQLNGSSIPSSYSDSMSSSKGVCELKQYLSSNYSNTPYTFFDVKGEGSLPDVITEYILQSHRDADYIFVGRESRQVGWNGVVKSVTGTSVSDTLLNSGIGCPIVVVNDDVGFNHNSNKNGNNNKGWDSARRNRSISEGGMNGWGGYWARIDGVYREE